MIIDYRSVLDTFTDAVVACDESGRIVYANAAAGRLLGWDEDALVGEPLTVIQPERMRAAHGVGFRRYLATRKATLIGRAVRVPARRRDGSEIEVELALSSVRLPGGDEMFVASLRDLGDRVELERRIAVGRYVVAQYAVMTAMTESLTVEEAAPKILAAIGEHLGWDVASFWRVDEGRGVLRVAAAWSSGADQAASYLERSLAATFAMGEGLPGRVWKERAAAWTPDVTTDPSFLAADRGASGAPGEPRPSIRGALLFPIGTDHVSAVLELASFAVQPIDEELLRTMATFGGQIGQFMDRLRADAALRESEERLAITLRSIRDAVLTTDIRGRVSYMNPVAERITGWSLERARGVSLAEVLPAPTCEPRDEPGGPTARGVDTVGPEYTSLRTQGGAELVVEQSGAPVRTREGDLAGGVVVFRDVTERRREAQWRQFLIDATAALAGSLDFRETLAMTARLSVPRLADWCIVDVLDDDGAVGRLAIAHADDAKVQHAWDIERRFPSDPTWSLGPMNVIRTGRAEVINGITEPTLAQMATSAEHLADLRGLGISAYLCVPLIARGRTLGAITLEQAESNREFGPQDVAMAEELASRAATALDNARLFEEAQRAVRVRDEFLSIASHELKTPITSLQLQVQSVLRGMKKASGDVLGGDGGLPKMQTIDRQVARLGKLVNQLLDLSRLTAGRIDLDVEDVDLTAAAHEVTARFADDAARAGCALSVDADERVVGRWDRARVDQVLTNLLSNAIKYGRGRPIELTVRAEPGKAICIVRDHGIGISTEFQARIFERFERAASARHFGGFGLGLWIVRQIVDALGGHISVESRPGEGSAFRLELPFEPPV